MPKAAVIYLLYNGRHYIADCFASLEKIDYPREQLEIIIIDNNSQDGSAEEVKSNLIPKSENILPHITFIENRENFGFAEGNNIGMRLAMERGCEYVYLLNQDTEVEPGFLREAVREAERHPEAGAVQSLILLYQEKGKLNSLGNAIHFLGFGYANGYKMNIAKAEAEIEKRIKKFGACKIAYASGAGVLYKVSALHEVGLLDQELFLYHEDLDLGWRLAMCGYDNILALKSRIYHKYEFSRSIKKYYWMERNRWIVLFKLYRLPTIIFLAIALFFGEFGLLLFSVRSGWFGEKIKGYKYFLSLKNWKNLWQARSEAQKRRKKSDCEIVDLFASKIDFQEYNQPLVKYLVNPLLTIYWIIVRSFIFW